MDDNRLDRFVEEAIARVAAMTDPEKLIQMHKNVLSRSDLTEVQTVKLSTAIEARLRTVAPAAATRTFGSKDREGRETLKHIDDQLVRDFDLSGNTVGSGVKTGGDMIAGKRHADVYISYKAADGWHAALAWLQDEPSSKPYFKVSRFQDGRSNSSTLTEETFSIAHEDLAVSTYRRWLTELIRPA